VVKKREEKRKRRYMSGQDFPEREILPGFFWRLLSFGFLPVLFLSSSLPFCQFRGCLFCPALCRKGEKGSSFCTFKWKGVGLLIAGPAC
jgi:hypothetical protein